MTNIYFSSSLDRPSSGSDNDLHKRWHVARQNKLTAAIMFLQSALFLCCISWSPQLSKTFFQTRSVWRCLLSNRNRYCWSIYTYFWACLINVQCGIIYSRFFSKIPSVEKNFTKKTAINSPFFNGKSFQPLNTFKAIITGEEKIMRRLNERNEDYHESLNRVKTKCIKSNFNQKLTEN